MFGRLLKHQLKTTWKEFNIAYAVIVFLGFLLALAIKSEHEGFLIVATTLFSCAVFALTGLMIYFEIKLFYHSTYGKQGFLTFTLPISTHALILSRIVSALLYMVGFVISFVLAISTFFLILSPSMLEEIIPSIIEALSVININGWIVVIYIIQGIITLLSTFVTLQFVFALSNTITSSKKKTWIIILLLFAVSSASSMAVQFDSIGLYIALNLDTNQLVLINALEFFESNYVPVMSIWSFVVELGKLIGFYLLTVYIIDKKIEVQ